MFGMIKRWMGFGRKVRAVTITAGQLRAMVADLDDDVVAGIDTASGGGGQMAIVIVPASNLEDVLKSAGC